MDTENKIFYTLLMALSVIFMAMTVHLFNNVTDTNSKKQNLFDNAMASGYILYVDGNVVGPESVHNIAAYSITYNDEKKELYLVTE